MHVAGTSGNVEMRLKQANFMINQLFRWKFVHVLLQRVFSDANKVALQLITIRCHDKLHLDNLCNIL
jgi:hypothetical protein